VISSQHIAISLLVGIAGFVPLQFQATADPDTPDGGLPLTPLAQGTYHNRNRDLIPQLGRFLQRDPNATAQPLITAAAFNAAVSDTLIDAIDLESHFIDGLNPYTYLNANPLKSRDPLGLYSEDDEIDALIGDLTGHKLYALDAIHTGAAIASIGLEASLEIAAALLNLTPGSLLLIAADGNAGLLDTLSAAATVLPGTGPLRAIAKAGKYARAAGKTAAQVSKKAAEHLFKILPYRQAQNVTRGFKNEIQAHHILEARHARRLDLNPKDLPAVILPRAMHSEISKALQSKLRTGTGKHTNEDILRVYQEVYSDFGHPEWVSRVEQYLR
jgi:hypothetical protein